jgi:hypothetical protein
MAAMLAQRLSHSLDFDIAHAVKPEEPLARAVPAAKELAAARNTTSNAMKAFLPIGNSFD